MTATSSDTAPAEGPAPPRGHRGWDVVLSLLAVFAVGVAQPFLDLLGRNAEFLVAHDVSRIGVVLLGLGVTFVPPLAAALVVLGVRRASAAGGVLVHAGFLALFTAVAVLIAVRIGGAGSALPGLVVLMVAVGVGVGAALLYQRSAALRRIARVAAIAAPVVVGLFLLATPARGIALPTEQQAVDVVAGDTLPPVVFVIFDELPVASLLDRSGEIDPALFPAFAGLAGDATFFRNTTTVHPTTVDAVPAALSGTYAKPSSLPVAGDFPTNLLALLQGSHTVRAAEPLSDLCTTMCRTFGSDASEGSVGELVHDLEVVAAHLVVPEAFAERLPAVDAAWRGFAPPATEGKRASAKPEAKAGKALDPAEKRAAVQARNRRQRAKLGARAPGPASPAGSFRRFLPNITPAPDPTVHFLHTLLPHRPWLYLPDGRRHTTRELHDRRGEPASDGRVWVDQPWPVAQAHQLHLLQIQFTDRLLGRLISRLKDQGLYDRAVIVVTADHGVSMIPGTSGRDLEAGSFGQLGSVPLLIKAPGQQQPEVNDRPLETVDILPTILDLMDVEPPAGLDGRSAFTPGPDRTERVAYAPDGTPWAFKVEQQPWAPAVEEKYRLFAAADGSLQPFQLAPDGTRELLGTSVEEAATGAAAAGLGVELDTPGAFDAVDLTAEAIPAAIRGVVHGVEEGSRPLTVAVAVNGTIGAVTRAELGDGTPGGFRAVIPPDLLRDGRNTVQFFAVGADGALSEISLSP